VTALIVISSIVGYLVLAAATFRYTTRRLLNNMVLEILEKRRVRAEKHRGAYGDWACEQLNEAVEIPDYDETYVLGMGVMAALLWPGFWSIFVPGLHLIELLRPRTADLPALRVHRREISERAELEELRKVAKREGWSWAVDGKEKGAERS